MNRQIKNIFGLLLIFAVMVMPVFAATGEENVRIVDGSKESKIERVEEKQEEKTDGAVPKSDGFNRLLQFPSDGVDTVLNFGPLEKATLKIVGLFVGGSVILTILAFAANNGRISLGSILGNWKAMVSGRNMMIWVFLGFCGFLLALAMMKYVSTTGVF